MSIHLPTIRSHFPALQLSDAGKPRVYFDNPGGTQVAQECLARMNHYLVQCNANKGGVFRTAMQSDVILEETRQALQEFINAKSKQEIVFGANMTTLTFQLAHAMAGAGWLKAGDEIICTRLDHDANVSPWLRLAQDTGAIVRFADINPADCTLRLDDFEQLLNEKTRLVAVGYASNASGTVNPVAQITAMAKAAGALVFVDAVQYALHGSIDVQALGADFLAFSMYKIFGPHVGVLWGKFDVLDSLPAYNVRPAGNRAPGKFMTGTQNHEGIAGTLGALEYIAWVGKEYGASHAAQFPHFASRQLHYQCGLAAMQVYEEEISRHLLRGLQAMDGITIHGITDLARLHQRVPTISFTHARISSTDIATRLAMENIYVWNGHFYAWEVVHRLNLMESGGMVRVGPVHYNTIEECDRLLDIVASL
jgi:cysteine desulfurase family protein (TIGR01976 family)